MGIANLKIASLIIGAAVASLMNPLVAKAATYEEETVEQENFVAVAVPYGNNYNLLVIEQIPGKQLCWREDNSQQQPITIEPLLLNFDFTGSCRRATDSNGYSIRIEGEDYGLNYLLNIVQRNGELMLIGTPRTPGDSKAIIIGRTHGLKEGMTKIQLNPGWQFTKRTYQGKTLGHVYFSATREALQDVPSLSETVARENTPINSVEKTDEAKEFTFAAPTSNNRNLPVINQKTENNSPKESLPLPTINSQPLPPPSNNSSQRNLSDLLVVEPTEQETITINKVSEKTQIPEFPPEPPNITAANSPTTYRVIVENYTQAEAEIKSLYPDSFRTTYQGKSVLQVGRFNSRDNANSVVKTISNMGLTANII